jgi:hypothetical protein
MKRLLAAFVAGLKMALLAQAPLIVVGLVIGLTWGADRIDPGFEAVGRWLWSCGQGFGPLLGLVGFLVGVLPGEAVRE